MSLPNKPGLRCRGSLFFFAIKRIPQLFPSLLQSSKRDVESQSVYLFLSASTGIAFLHLCLLPGASSEVLRQLSINRLSMNLRCARTAIPASVFSCLAKPAQLACVAETKAKHKTENSETPKQRTENRRDGGARQGNLPVSLPSLHTKINIITKVPAKRYGTVVMSLW